MSDLGAFKDAKVLITGGLGFIGSNLARRLVELGATVTVLDSLIPEYGGNLFNISGFEDRLKINISDVRDSYSMQYLVRGHDYLFNFAGQTSHMDSMENPYIDLDINCRSQLFILESCRLYNPHIKIIFASTRQVYGKPEYLPVDEKHPLRPVDINGINKLGGERYHILYHNVYGIASSILRLTNTYGPRMRVKDARQTFLGVWIRCLVEGESFEVWEGGQLRDFTYVDDVVDAMLLVAANNNSYGQIFNLGGDCAISLNELARLLVEINGGGEYKVYPFPKERKKIDIGDFYADFKKITDTFGWKPKVSLRKGLECTLHYYRNHLKNYYK